MTNLGKFFIEQQRAQGVTAKKLAGRMNIDPTIISRAKGGEWRSFEPESIIRMIAGISEDHVVKLQLVRAILQDVMAQCVGIRPEAIKITVREDLGRVREDEDRGRKPATPLLAAIQNTALGETDIDALTVIVRNFRKNPALRRLVLAAADLGRRTERSPRDSKI
jgi:hypothetical protein